MTPRTRRGSSEDNQQHRLLTSTDARHGRQKRTWSANNRRSKWTHDVALVAFEPGGVRHPCFVDHSRDFRGFVACDGKPRCGEDLCELRGAVHAADAREASGAVAALLRILARDIAAAAHARRRIHVH